MNNLFKTIIITLVILAVTGITGAGVYALGQNAAVQSAVVGTGGPGAGRGAGEGMGRGRIERGAPPANAQGMPFPMRPEGEQHREGGEGFSAAGLVGVARNVGLIALITFVIVVAQRLFGLLFKRKPRPQSAGGSSS